MVKKTSETNLTTSADEIIPVNNSTETNPPVEAPTVSIGHVQQQARVNSIIHEWLTDMWLLTTGEELGNDPFSTKKQNGRPLAIVCDGQMKLTESRPFALDALRAVGIEMS
ncbi:MAG TPA: hypothetical protein PLD20_04700 [Blastocatellia bacterium]|nr:hypothetical protein [Blastocatellia bacterium]HMV81704.1 hypothetical protein [Blastocatellia bacterium]HMX24562.1 hypothetical protein [Blastocatellia bacterium]HMY74220.1 hypothetical protein [Blastocatellia bacterium]HMZ17207.1 hypothetical protein [Blastocatellia bacterium]